MAHRKLTPEQLALAEAGWRTGRHYDDIAEDLSALDAGLGGRQVQKLAHNLKWGRPAGKRVVRHTKPTGRVTACPEPDRSGLLPVECYLDVVIAWAIKHAPAAITASGPSVEAVNAARVHLGLSPYRVLARAA